MIKGLKKWDFLTFSGERNYEQPDRLPADILYLARNVDIEGGKIKSRPGYEAFGSEIVGGTGAKALLPYEIDSETRLVTFVNKDLYYHNGSDWTQIVDTLTADENIDGVPYANKLYTVSPTDGMGELDDTTFQIVDSNRKVSRIIIWKESSCLLGDVNAPYTLIISRAATAANPEYIYDFTPSSSPREVFGGGGPLVGGKVLNENLYIFAKRKAWELTGFDYTVTPPAPVRGARFDVGAINGDAIAVVENDI